MKNIHYLKKMHEIFLAQPRVTQHLTKLVSEDCSCKMAEECVVSKHIVTKETASIMFSFV